jgi:hypothetical protein
MRIEKAEGRDQALGRAIEQLADQSVGCEGALNVRGVRAGSRLVLWCWLSRRPRLLLLLLELLLLFLLRHVVADGAAGRSAQHSMMAGHVSGYGADGGTLETALGLGALTGGQ